MFESLAHHYKNRLRVIVFSLLLISACIYLISSEGYKISAIILCTLTFLHPAIETLWVEFVKREGNTKNNKRLIQEAETDFGFIQFSRKDLTIDSDVLWDRRECYRKLIEAHFPNFEDSEKSAMEFLSLLNAHDRIRGDLEKEAILKHLQDKFRKFTFPTADRLLPEELKLGEAYFCCKEKTKLNFSGTADGKIIKKSLFELARKINAPQAYDFLVSDLRKTKELRENLREIMRTKFPENEIKINQSPGSVKGAYMIVGKSIPKEVEKYFGTLPTLRMRSFPYAANFPGHLTSQPIVVYLVRPVYGYKDAKHFSDDIKARIKKVKDDPRKSKTEIIVVNIDTKDVDSFSIGKPSTDNDSLQFRQAALYFLTGVVPQIYVTDREDPLAHLWKTNLSFEEILKRLSPVVLCGDLSEKEKEMINALFPLVQKELDVQDLLDWRTKDSKAMRDSFEKHSEKAKCSSEVRKFIDSHRENLEEFNHRLLIVSNQIVRNANKYHDSLYGA